MGHVQKYSAEVLDAKEFMKHVLILTTTLGVELLVAGMIDVGHV